MRGLLHGVQVDTRVGRQFHRHYPRGEPDNLNVELARLLREKHKKKMMVVGAVEIPQSAFVAVLKTDKDS